MRKQIFWAFLLIFGLTTGGCAWFGGDSSSTEAVVTPAQPEPAAEPAPAPEKTAPAKADKKAAKPAEKKQPAARGAKTEAQIAAELDVASYVAVDEDSVVTELRPGASGQYVGFVRYKENVFECRGASRQAALAAACQQVKARRINELIRYDGKSWQY